MKIVINNWHEGLVPHFWNSNFPNSANLLKNGTDNMYVAGSVNPFMQLGLLCPSNGTRGTVTDSGTAITSAAFVRFVLSDDDNISSGVPSIYGGSADRVHGVNLGNTTIVSTGEFPHTISAATGTHSGHSSFTLRDMIPYQVNGSARLWYFYTDSVDGDAGTYDMESSFDREDAEERVFSNAVGGGVLNGKYDIIAEVSNDPFAYIGNKNILYKIDGTTSGGASATITQVLTFEPDSQIRDMKDSSGFIWIGVLKSRRTISQGLTGATRRANVLAWDRRTTSVSQIVSYTIDGVSDIKSLVIWRGIPHVFVDSTRGVDELRKFTGNSFETIVELDTSSAPSTRFLVYPTDRFLMWVGADELVYAYGSLDPKLPDGLFIIGDLSSFSDINSWINMNGSTFHIGCNDGTTTRVKTWSPFAVDGNAEAGDWRSKVFELPKLSTINGITMYWPPLSGGADANLTLTTYANNSNTATDSITTNYQNLTAGEGNRGWKDIALGGRDYSNVNYFQIGLAWNTGQTISNSIRPSRIEINYNETTQSDKKKK